MADIALWTALNTPLLSVPEETGPPGPAMAVPTGPNAVLINTSIAPKTHT